MPSTKVGPGGGLVGPGGSVVGPQTTSPGTATIADTGNGTDGVSAVFTNPDTLVSAYIPVPATFIGASHYELFLSDATGSRLPTNAITLGGAGLTDLQSAYSLKYTRVANAVGTLTLDLPGTFDVTFIKKHGRIELYRGVTRGAMKLEGIWLIMGYTETEGNNGLSVISVKAVSLSWILKTRYALYSENTTYTRKAEPGDDMMKDIVRENLGATAVDVARNLSTWLTVQSNASIVPNIFKAFARQNIDETLRGIAETAYEAGYPLYYDVVPTDNGMFEFQVFHGQRGNDRRTFSGNGLLFGPDYGNITGSSYSVDWENEVTHATAFGPGQENLALIVQQQDTVRIGQSPFGRCEGIVSSQSTTTLNDDARSVLRKNRPVQTFQGKIVDTPQARYGVHWGWGDYVTIQRKNGQSMDGRIDAISVDVSGGKETIDAAIKIETTL